jgi:hypothetical protein
MEVKMSINGISPNEIIGTPLTKEGQVIGRVVDWNSQTEIATIKLDINLEFPNEFLGISSRQKNKKEDIYEERN